MHQPYTLHRSTILATTSTRNSIYRLRYSSNTTAQTLFPGISTIPFANNNFLRDNASRDNVIRYYFSQLYTAKDVKDILSDIHHIQLNERHLKRLQKRLNLQRAGQYSLIETVVHQIVRLYGEGYVNIGYIFMWNLRNVMCGVRVTQETVRIVMAALDPDGVNLDDFVHIWNLHRIRSQLNTETFSGIPNIMIYQPETFAAQDFSVMLPYSVETIERVSNDLILRYPEFGCRDEFMDVIEVLTGTMRHDFPFPNTVDDALVLFYQLTGTLDRMFPAT
ncbi:unnamed protein product [Mytilus coruscus]|uniref:Uncharacterized protein n=1 Tax=Mytilus coruscus TaxID=42192 RepID=A0A6J8E7P2_MYTCO|nr:unnamed protein product [Mytilus coruscus]